MASLDPNTNLNLYLSDYWDAAYAEGKSGRTTDTVDGAAQRTLDAIKKEVRRMVGAARDSATAAQRARDAAICHDVHRNSTRRVELALQCMHAIEGD